MLTILFWASILHQISSSLAKDISPTPAPTGNWTNEKGDTILIEIIIYSIVGGIVGLVLMHYIALFVSFSLFFLILSNVTFYMPVQISCEASKETDATIAGRQCGERK